MARQIGCVLGIDPGKHGGFALISPDDIVLTFPMPETEFRVGELFRERFAGKVSHCQIEKVHAMPRDRKANIFTFGRNTGMLIGMLIAFKIPFKETDPKIWQGGLGIPKRIRTPKKAYQQKALIDADNVPMQESDRDWKKRLMAIAKNLFPGHAVTLETADALLIAEFARREHFGYLGRPVL
jgi:hypothetical protein